MKLLKIVNIIETEIAKYPIKGDFKLFITGVLQYYNECIQDSTDLFDGLNYPPYLDEDEFKNRSKETTENLIKTIEYYIWNNGIDGKVFDFISKAFDNCFEGIPDTIVTLPSNVSFYRLREFNKGDEPLIHKDLFHVPFDKRQLIATKRFSLPGVPCLYLSNSTYVAWNELDEPPIIKSARFINTQPINIIDLDATPFKNKKDKGDPKSLIYHALKLPLVMASSLKIRDKKHNFKFEYIVPQLILEYIRFQNKQYNYNLTDRIYGVRYRSTRIVQNKVKGEFINYAILPIKTDCDDGYCTELQKVFHISKDIIEESLIDVYQKKSRLLTLNDPIDTILIKGIPLKFKKSKFATIEDKLKKSPTHLLPF